MKIIIIFFMAETKQNTFISPSVEMYLLLMLLQPCSRKLWGKWRDGVSVNSRHVGLMFAMPQPVPQMCLRLPILPIQSKSTSSERKHAFFAKVGVSITLFWCNTSKCGLKKPGNPASVTLGLPNTQVSVEQDGPYRTIPPLRKVTDPVCHLWELPILY